MVRPNPPCVGRQTHEVGNAQRGVVGVAVAVRARIVNVVLAAEHERYVWNRGREDIGGPSHADIDQCATEAKISCAPIGSRRQEALERAGVVSVAELYVNLVPIIGIQRPALAAGIRAGRSGRSTRDECEGSVVRRVRLRNGPNPVERVIARFGDLDFLPVKARDSTGNLERHQAVRVAAHGRNGLHDLSGRVACPSSPGAVQENLLAVDAQLERRRSAPAVRN